MLMVVSLEHKDKASPYFFTGLFFKFFFLSTIVGKYTPSNYWIIETPTGGTCWLWGAYATVQGNVAPLAEMAPPTASSVAVAPTALPTSGSSSSSSNPSPTPTTKPIVLKPILVNPGLIQLFAKPAAPSNLTVSTTCTYNVFHFLSVRSDHLIWPTVSNATGYSVYENGSKISSTTGTSINLIGASTTGSVSFGVAAYNSNGTSGTTSASAHCP